MPCLNKEGEGAKLFERTQALDGEMDAAELRLWRRVGIALGRGPLSVDERALRGVAQAFRNRIPLSANDLSNALDDDENNDHAVRGTKAQYMWHRVQNTLMM